MGGYDFVVYHEFETKSSDMLRKNTLDVITLKANQKHHCKQVSTTKTLISAEAKVTLSKI